MSATQFVRAKKLTLGVAVLAAIAASSCCIGPLVLAALGIGGAGAFVTLGAYRPYILAVTALLLSSGFYLTYRKPRAGVEGEACACERPNAKVGRAGRAGLWIATGLVVILATAPNVLAWAARDRDAAVASAPGAALARATVRVQGMDCEACAAHIRGSLVKVGGFHDLTLDLKGQTVMLAYEPAPGRLPAYVAAINALGYEASLPAQTDPKAR